MGSKDYGESQTFKTKDDTSHDDNDDDYPE